MKTKTFNHKEIEICRISKKEINTEKDRYSVILDCEGDEIYSTGFYKTDELKDLIKGQGKIIAQGFARRLNDTLKKMFNSNPMLSNIIKSQEIPLNGY